MSTDQMILFALFALVFAALIWGRWRYDLVAFSALMAGVVLGVVPTEDAFSGFGHEATLIVALVLVISAGLVRSGAVQLISRTLLDSSRSLGAHISVMGALGGALSAFMNNVAALALLMPVDVETARKAGRRPGLSLMPLSFATILGGMATLIGTPPNIIVASIRRESLGEPFRMFDFAPVGALTAVAGLIFVAVIGWRLIPQPKDDGALQAGREEARYIAELTIPKESKLAGRTLGSLGDDADKSEVLLLGLVRSGNRLSSSHGREMKEGDAVVVEATPEALDEFRAALGLELADEPHREALEDVGLAITEVVIPVDSRLAGRTAAAIGLTWRRRAAIVGISRRGKRITRRLRQAVIRPGDILLLLAPAEETPAVIEWLGALPLADRGLTITDQKKTWLAIGLFAGAVVAASFGLIQLPFALGIVVALYAFTRIVPLSELYDQIQWPVVVLLGSMIPLGTALETSGGTELVARNLVWLTDGWPAWAILTVLMIVTMTLSDVLNNTATAIVAAPIGIDMAQRLDVSPDPFLMAVAVAASCAFLTPIGHKNNTLILGPGGYSFGDYWRMGLPLEILVVAVSIPAILVFWPL